MPKKGAKGKKRAAPASKARKEEIVVSDVEEDEQVQDVSDAEQEHSGGEENGVEEDAPPAAKRGRPSKGKGKSPAKAHVSDEDEADEEHESEEEAPTSSKKGRGRPAGKAKAKAKPVGKGKGKGKGKAAAKPKKETSAESDTEEDPEKEYAVERIVDMKETKKGRLFLVKWEGYSAQSNTWEPEEHLDCPEKLEAFQKKLDERKNVTEKTLRTERKQTKPYQDSVRNQGVRASRRFSAKPRTTYHGQDE